MPDQKVVFITGAARGLGAAIARIFAANGYRLYLVDILEDRLNATAQELRGQGADVTTRQVDVSSREQDFGAIDDCITVYGQLDVLVNCAGIVRFNHAPDVPEDEWQKILGINLSGPFFLIQASLPHIIVAEGNIVNIASSNGLTGTPYTLPYSATKAAVINMTKTLAMEYMDSPIRINTVCPGPMMTEIGTDVVRQPTMSTDKIIRYSGMRGASEATEIAEVVAFLASDKASAVHGAIWPVDTGVTAG